MQLLDWLRKILRKKNNTFAIYIDRVVLPVGIAALVLLTPFAINNFLQGRIKVGLAILLVQALLLVDVLALRRGEPPPLHYGLLIVPMIIAMLVAVLRLGILGALWGYPIVLICHFVLSRRLALLFSVGILAALTFVIAYWIDPALAARMFASLLLTIAMINIVLNVIGELQDALVQQSEGLKLERDRLELIIKTAQDGFWLMNASTGQIVDVNESSSSMLGYTREELLTRRLTDIDAQWAPEEIGREMQKVKTVGGAVFETRHHAKGGQIINVEVSVNYLLAADQFCLFIRNITERKRAEEKLLESEEKYRSILESIEDGYFEVDIAGNFTFFNDSVCRIFGNTRAELIGMNNRQYTDKENSQILYQAFNKVFKTGEPLTGVDYEIIRKDGTKLYIESSASLIRNKSGQPIGFRGIMRNITERKRTEQEIGILVEIRRLISSTLDIEEVYERFAVELRKLIPFERITINLNDPDQNTITVAYASGSNVPGRRLGDTIPLKGSVNEVLARTKTGILLHPTNTDELTGQYPHLVSTFQEGINSFMSVPLIYRDELIGVLHFRAKKPNAYTKQDLQLAERIGGQIAGAIANAQLYTGLKKTEMSLRESEGRFRSLFEQAAVGVAEIVMETSQFITVNQRLCEMTGRTEDEMLNTTFQAITHPEDLHLHEEKTRMMLAGQIDHYTLEKRYLRKDGESVWVNITVSPLWKPGEMPERNIAVVEDITERKRMEAEILALSITDQLTGLHNRRGFLSLAEQQLKLAERNKSGMLLFFADLDGLKWINDTLGHEEGDKALIEAATVFKETFRTSDIIARLGGDEYAALAVDITEASSEIFTSRLQSLIDKRNSQENLRYRLSISIGYSCYDPENSWSMDELMASADKLMYEQKQNKKSTLPQEASLSNGIH